MRSRAARVAVVLLTIVGFVSAAFVVGQLERQIQASHSALRAFDHDAREAADALADLRSAQQAYVAQGQGAAFWTAKASSILERVKSALGNLQKAAATTDAKAALAEAEDTVEEFDQADGRVRGYLSGGQPLMAADVVFTEGGPSTATAARHIEAARLAELQAADGSEAGRRRQQAMALGGAALIALISLVALVPGAGRPREEPEAGEETYEPAAPSVEVLASDLPLHRQIDAGTAPPRLLEPPQALPAPEPALGTIAELCTDFGRVATVDELRVLLGRAADLMNASGIVLWIGDQAGSDLRPALGSGYPPQAFARMPSVPRSSDNAAAAAYRSGQLQVVRAGPNAPAGAVVAPLVTPEGCIGALSAEVAPGDEELPRVHAVAAIVAAQLAGIVGAGSGARNEAASA
jgi:hypothetical protein